MKKGTCSRTFFYLLSKEFGFSMVYEGRALDPLAGGFGLSGEACGALVAAIN